MTKAKKDTPAPGHNSGNLAEQDRKVLFFINRRNYLAKLEAKKAADAALKLVGKQIKADLGENGLHQIKTYEKLRTAEGAEEIKAKREAEAQAMRFAGIPEGTQLDLLEHAPLDERAFRDGEEAGLRGETLSNPYNEASEAGQQYAAGWHQGQGALFEGIKKKEAEASPDELIKADDTDDDPFSDQKAAEAAWDAADPAKVAAE